MYEKTEKCEINKIIAKSSKGPLGTVQHKFIMAKKSSKLPTFLHKYAVTCEKKQEIDGGKI